MGHIKACEKVKKPTSCFVHHRRRQRQRPYHRVGHRQPYEPEELIGKDVCFIANLAPRKLMGIESQGMIFSREFRRQPAVTTVQREVKPGSQVC